MLNKAILVGRLTADPELKQTLNGVSVCSFSIAINRPYSGKGGERQTDFINIVAWRATAEFVAKYFRKGNAIGVDGSIQTRSYTDKQGNKRTAFEVVADAASFVEGKQSAEGSERLSQGRTAAPQAEYIDIGCEDEDLPFN
ncbi:single-stranded DNA-binding protein [Phocea massiliensis]|uniref:single-stranded DNA-binding protein n=1 Tax=Merdimmobilis hominis TaxID=2897707 RepID=UPI001E44F924|nr:single-stranded DNA-binding protein [Merdimmobilis hominis]MCD4835653.1 single-stranded DNA-binding protein [Merdimmobilis hominis]